MAKYIISFFFTIFLIGQEVSPPENIKSIVFRKQSGSDTEQIPILRLGELFFLSFDDLNALESEYYYTITHCDYNWNRSSLINSEYLEGLDFKPIPIVENSYATIQSYTSYRLEIPNRWVSIKISGNYLLTVYDSDENVVFTRRFIVYTDKVQVLMQVKRVPNVRDFDTSQQISFKIKDVNRILKNPQKTLKVAVLQNFNWNTLRDSIFPTYTFFDELVYDTPDNKKLVFEAGNEYFYFENKDIRATSSAVAQVDKQQMYHCYLYANTVRNHSTYTYQPDINGNFNLSDLPGISFNEMDYVWVHFYLDVSFSEFQNKEIYVYGKFTNYDFSDKYKLNYHPEKKMYEGKFLLKQGFYNYKFATKTKDKIDFNAIGGNFYQTENEYIVLVYYRKMGDVSDKVIGVGVVRSDSFNSI